MKRKRPDQGLCKFPLFRRSQRLNDLQRIASDHGVRINTHAVAHISILFNRFVELSFPTVQTDFKGRVDRNHLSALRRFVFRSLNGKLQIIKPDCIRRVFRRKVEEEKTGAAAARFIFHRHRTELERDFAPARADVRRNGSGRHTGFSRKIQHRNMNLHWTLRPHFYRTGKDVTRTHEKLSGGKINHTFCVFRKIKTGALLSGKRIFRNDFYTPVQIRRTHDAVRNLLKTGIAHHSAVFILRPGHRTDHYPADLPRGLLRVYIQTEICRIVFPRIEKEFTPPPRRRIIRGSTSKHLSVRGSLNLAGKPEHPFRAVNIIHHIPCFRFYLDLFLFQTFRIRSVQVKKRIRQALKRFNTVDFRMFHVPCVPGILKRIIPRKSVLVDSFRKKREQQCGGQNPPKMSLCAHFFSFFFIASLSF